MQLHNSLHSRASRCSTRAHRQFQIYANIYAQVSDLREHTRGPGSSGGRDRRNSLSGVRLQGVWPLTIALGRLRMRSAEGWRHQSARGAREAQLKWVWRDRRRVWRAIGRRVGGNNRVWRVVRGGVRWILRISAPIDMGVAGVRHTMPLFPVRLRVSRVRCVGGVRAVAQVATEGQLVAVASMGRPGGVQTRRRPLGREVLLATAHLVVAAAAAVGAGVVSVRAAHTRPVKRTRLLTAMGSACWLTA